MYNSFYIFIKNEFIFLYKNNLIIIYIMKTRSDYNLLYKQYFVLLNEKNQLITENDNLKNEIDLLMTCIKEFINYLDQ
tara:strand:- start:154 stop:387 length:234 start_codon:yes stop_codon:yes gene_type:complete